MRPWRGLKPRSRRRSRQRLLKSRKASRQIPRSFTPSMISYPLAFATSASRLASAVTPPFCKGRPLQSIRDCKDKHTLFEALLAASGIKSYPVLISSVYQVNPDHPSPALFKPPNHSDSPRRYFLFLDTTPEVAPFGLLSFPVRDKFALVIPDQGPSRLVKTPADTIS